MLEITALAWVPFVNIPALSAYYKWTDRIFSPVIRQFNLTVFQECCEYQLEYKLASASIWSIISSSLSAETVTYTKTGLVNGTSYGVRIKTKDSPSSWSGYSDIVEEISTAII